MGVLDILLGDLKTTQKPSYITYPYKFMKGYLHFSNNLKDIKYHIQADMISCKIFFQLMVTVFKEKLNLQLPLIFYSSIRFVFETAFISEQSAENRFRGLIEISDKFIAKFNVFSYMILHVRLKTVWKISKPYCMTLKTVARQFCWKGHSLYQKSQGQTFRNGKRFEDKAQYLLSPPPLPPTKYGGTFFKRKFCMGEQTFSGKFWGDVLHGSNDQIMQRGKLMVKRFQRSGQVSFSSH